MGKCRAMGGLTLLAVAGCVMLPYEQVDRGGPLVIRGTYWSSGQRYSMGGPESLTGFGGAELDRAFRNTPEAYQEYQAWRSGAVPGMILGGAGAACIGIPLGAMLGSREDLSGTGKAVLVSGVVMTVVGYALEKSRRPHLMRAVEIYNDGRASRRGSSWGFRR